MQFLTKTKRIFDKYSFIFYIALLYAFFALIGIGCPIRFFTGISCFGCGMTRAFLSLLQLDFVKAYTYHPLIYLMPFAIAFLIFRNKLSKKVQDIIIAIIVILFILVYVIRLVKSDPIVKWDFTDSIIYKLFIYIKGL